VLAPSSCHSRCCNKRRNSIGSWSAGNVSVHAGTWEKCRANGLEVHDVSSLEQTGRCPFRRSRKCCAPASEVSWEKRFVWLSPVVTPYSTSPCTCFAVPALRPSCVSHITAWEMHSCGYKDGRRLQQFWKLLQENLQELCLPLPLLSLPAAHLNFAPPAMEQPIATAQRRYRHNCASVRNACSCNVFSASLLSYEGPLLPSFLTEFPSAGGTPSP
jgi:hypothetical protein